MGDSETTNSSEYVAGYDIGYAEGIADSCRRIKHQILSGDFDVQDYLGDDDE